MNVSTFTRLAGLLLVAGFFYSCGSSGANLDELIANNNYQKALTEIDSRLDENPSQPALYIQRGEINAELARETDPELRAEFYTKTADDFNSAIEYDASESQLSTIDSLRQQYWKDEHNAGLRISENEAVSERYQRSEIHFQNALILRPDAVSSYRNLSVAQFNLGEIDEAITSLETALDYADEPSAELYENLGYLYLEKGNPAEAAQYYELANTNMEDDLNLAFGLINAYISNGNSAEAANMLETLVDENPQNANLRNVYGTQLYEITSDILEELKTAYSDNNSELTEDLRAEAEEMGQEAEEHLIEAFKRDTSNTKYLESLAVFYNNLASQYLALTKVSFENDRTALRQKAYTLIDFAIEYYEKLIDIDPNNDEYGDKLEVLKKLKERQTVSANN
ncbi:MAG: tetratricopeptide repeat protein [Gracilimonas sp.]|uniref:tetratricopeptide repeat protein n=1 Tax=Gracilimonas sp. TaxID=1974203 RepID=UPI00199694C1|nr:tetratricopeptide repeat protein [Gracilimonas sp.]MBD3617623.1 tetratricopeptide repeat protein [Gracilimonas sp.]